VTTFLPFLDKIVWTIMESPPFTGDNPTARSPGF
jgi:hypothetical protein